MKNQKGFANILIIILSLLVIGGGAYIYLDNNYSEEEILLDDKGNEYVVVDDIVAPKETADFIPTKKELTQEFEKRTPEVDDENFDPAHSRSKLLAEFSIVRVHMEMYEDSNDSYSGSCNYLKDELIKDVIVNYNSRSVDEYTNVQWYPKITSVPGLECVETPTTYAITFEVVENDLSKTLKCIDSSGFFGDGLIKNNLCTTLLN